MNPMSSFSTEGILLKRIEFGDHDLIVTYFTCSMGRISVLAKNAKKSMKRFAGVLDPFSAMGIECSQGKRKNTLPILCSVDLNNPFANIRTDVLKTGYASYWMELIHSWVEEGKAHKALYDLLFYVLDALNTDSVPKEVLSLFFQIRFITLSGFTPDFLTCGSCSTPLDDILQDQIFFDLINGRLACKCCGFNGIRYKVKVSKGTLKQLLYINSDDMKRIERIKFSPSAIREGETLLESFIPCHIGREVKSLMFLRRIRGCK